MSLPVGRRDRIRAGSGLDCGWTPVVMLLRPASNPLLGDQGLPACYRSFRLAEGRGLRVYKEGAPGARVPGEKPPSESLLSDPDKTQLSGCREGKQAWMACQVHISLKPHNSPMRAGLLPSPCYRQETGDVSNCPRSHSPCGFKARGLAWWCSRTGVPP